MSKWIVLLAATVIACAPPATVPPRSPEAPSQASSSRAATSATPAVTAPARSPAITTVDVATAAATQPLAELGGVRFVDQRRGWLGLGDGLVGTTDAGATWSKELSSARILKIRAYD